MTSLKIAQYAFLSWFRVRGGVIGPSVFLAIMFTVEGSFWSHLSDQGSLSGYSSAEILAYAFISLVVSQVVACTGEPDSASQKIEAGQLDPLLIRPYGFLPQMFCHQVGISLARLLWLVPLVALVEIACLGEVRWPGLFSLVITLPLGAGMNFLINQILATGTFYFQDSYFLVTFKETLFWIASGALIPLDLFPKSVATGLSLLPPAYIGFFPVKVALGQASFSSLVAAQLLYVMVLTAIASLTWTLGVRRYQAYGG
jgi:ABC-2 type transport system permease protein